MLRNLALHLPCLLFLLFSTARAVEPSAESVVGAAEPKTDAAVYGEGVRSTQWLAPEDQRAGFHLPPEFEVGLFASEPQIAKPLNMAFDGQGRMWVTHSVEYPYPAKDGDAARDGVSILEDTDGDGAADAVQLFADALNIPIGVLPYGEGCLCFSIPNLWYLRDTDGDGVCDQRDVVLGPFDTTRDTHGMINSLRDGGDGWIYACHGFNNQSQVAGTDGHVVTMSSGNTFRFRADGSRVEHVTHGQVNPFGMTEDEWGYRYTADCHSKPITQLVYGACYPSFGRPHDGLGFLPPMVDHLHGSTAISGILYLPPSSPIVPLRGQLISGNVMTSRLNRNKLVFDGATAKGQELADFLTSDDPWFRPVDIQLGPDGCLYVADFYNKIIGHYEVPLDHPGRDRTSGRIWRIRYTGGDDTAKPVLYDGDGCDLRLAEFKRRFADRKISGQEITNSLADECAQVRVAAIRLASADIDRAPLEHAVLEAVRSALADKNAHVKRAAAELIGRQGDADDIGRLLAQLSQTPASDPVLRQSIRIAVRDLLRGASTDAEFWSIAATADVASILLGIKRQEASAVLLKYLSAHHDAEDRDMLLAHAARHAGPTSLGNCVRIAREITGEDRAKQFALLDVLCSSQNARPGNVPAAIRQWALGLVAAELALAKVSDRLVGWTADDGGDWPREKRRLRGAGEAMLVSSLGRGEKYTGRLVSDPFAAPDEIGFWLAGHNGFPKEDDHGKNRVRLVLVETGEVLHEATPPRNDTARHVRWDTGAASAGDVRIECIDGDSAAAFAWIAVGRFQPAWIQDSAASKSLALSLGWIKRLGLDEHAGELQTMLGRDGFSRRLRIEIARTIASLRKNHQAAIVLQFLQTTDAPSELVEPTIDAMLSADRATLLESTKVLCKRLSSSQQRQFAVGWATSGADMQMLVDMAQWGWISREVFADPTAQQAIAPRLDETQRGRVSQLTKDLDLGAGQSELLSRLQNSIATRQGDRENGHRLYTKHCAACHQLRGEGAVVGPQLDGAASRSAARLLEDVVTPDRNIDQAFRTTSFLLDEGRVIVGLVTAETADEITVVESSGKAITIDPDSVELRREAGRSLMPSNMGEVLSAEEFSDLIRFVRGPK